MKRSKPLLRTAMKPRGEIKPKTCDFCGDDFFPRNTLQVVCGRMCALRKVRRDKAEIVKQDRAAKEAAKRLPDLKKEAQREVNRYCRARDRLAGHGCICCGKPLDWNSGMPGGAVDAGHYLSRGSAPELALDVRNISAQRKSCNRPGGTTRLSFRAGMIQRWGLEVVEELEGPQEPKRYRHDDYRRIRDHYRALAVELEKQIAMQG